MTEKRTHFSADIVERLRVWPAGYGEDTLSSTIVGRLMKDAADEIEGLRLEHKHACQEIAVAIATGKCPECGWSGGGVRDEGCMIAPCPRMPAPAQAVPVAWRWRTSPAHYWALTELYPGDDVTDVQPLYASQPSPAATVETDADLPTFQDVRGILPRSSAGSASDLLERLRMKAKPHETIAVFVALCQEAAAQIEEQSKQLNWAQGEIDRLLTEPQTAAEPPFLESLKRTLKTMKLAHSKGGDRLMSVWTEDMQAVEEAISALSLSRPTLGRDEGQS